MKVRGKVLKMTLNTSIFEILSRKNTIKNENFTYIKYAGFCGVKSSKNNSYKRLSTNRY